MVREQETQVRTKFGLYSRSIRQSQYAGIMSHSVLPGGMSTGTTPLGKPVSSI